VNLIQILGKNVDFAEIEYSTGIYRRLRVVTN
jgi:hypothetical protein